MPGSDGGAVSTVVLPSKIEVKILPHKVTNKLHESINKSVKNKYFACTTGPNTQQRYEAWERGSARPMIQ